MIVLLAVGAWAQDFEDCAADGTLSRLGVEEARVAVDVGFRDPVEGEQVLTGLLDRHPDCGALWRARAGVLHAQGLDAEAERDLRRSIAVGDRFAVRALAVHLHHRQGAGPVLDEAVSAFPDDASLKILQAAERPVSARTALLERAHALHPDDRDVTGAYMDALALAGRPWEAIETGRSWLVAHEDPAIGDQVAALEAPFAETERFRPTPESYRLLEDGTEEVVVYSPERARLELEARLQDLGWTEKKAFRGGIRYRSELPVQPYVDLYDDGQVVVQSRGFVKPRALPDPTQTMIPVISARKLRNKRIRMMEDIAPEVWRWQQSIARAAFTERLDSTLPDQIAALWREGIALDGPVVYGSLEQRRDALVQHWQTRDCSAEGDAVREVIERFVRNVVQESAVALDATAVAAAEAGCACPGRWLVGAPLGIPVE